MAKPIYQVYKILSKQKKRISLFTEGNEKQSVRVFPYPPGLVLT